MANPFNIINPNNPLNNNTINQMKSIYQKFNSAKNPIQLLQQYAVNNPRAQQILKMINSGMNPQQVLQNFCSQNGINPQELINMIKS